MIDLEGLKTAILNQLKSYTGAVEVIFADQEGKRPQGPYLTMKATTPYGQTGTHTMNLKEAVLSTDPRFEKDIMYSFVSFPKVTLSITAYNDEPNALIQKAREWFNIRRLSRDTLEVFNSVVRDLSAVQNRDAVIGDVTYERKQGFDVTLSVKDTVNCRESTIETVIINDESVDI